MTDNLLYDVWLSTALRSCSRRMWEAIELYGDSKAIFDSLSGGTLRVFDAKELERLRMTNLAQAQAIIDRCAKMKYEIITYSDERYPELLNAIYNPPLLLYCSGITDLLRAGRKISVVGTRKPSAYSVGVAEEFCARLAENNFVTVSGFALGIDSVAHRSTLLNGGFTIAVIGCGLDFPYPRENFSERGTFIKRGLIISEFVPSAKPERWCFPHRNRILSGLSMATLVIEAGEKSGSLVTAHIAAEQGRDVFSIPPHDVFDPNYFGNAALLRNGAICASSYRDILDEYSVFDVSNIPIRAKSHEENEGTKEDIEHANADKPVPQKAFSIPEDLPENEKNVLELLQQRDMLIDELGFETGLDIAELFLILTELELDGCVESKAGNIYGISG